MLKITPISAAQAKDYYTKDDYYTQGNVDKNESRWFGRGAQALGLVGEVDQETFQLLLDGSTPQGAPLRARKSRPNDRAGYDLTFSADKSVSYWGLVRGDYRVIKAHDKAVTKAMEVAEKYAQVRCWNPEEQKQESITTGNFIAAIFRHETSRNLDPQLHSHGVPMNGTKDENGRYRALHVDEIFNQRPLIQLVYHNELAYLLRQCGYTVERTEKGSCRIQGCNEQLLKDFSSRRRDIEMGVDRRVAAGAKRTGALQQVVAITTRTRKQDVSHEQAAVAWRAKARDAGEADKIPESREIEPADLTDLVHDAISHAAQRESVFKLSRVLQFALNQGEIGHCSFDQLQRAIEDANELIKVESNQDKYTTQSAIDQERETIQMLQQGEGTQPPISSVDRVHEICPNHLTEGQRQGLNLLLTTSDRVVGWQGVAGAGKTYALAIAIQEAENNNYSVRCFAPSAEAAKELGDQVGSQADTVASLLVSHVKPPTQPQLWIVDEAGLLSTKDSHTLLRRAETQNARVVLVGDTKQLSSVEAGNPFRSLQAAGMATAYLEESLRQKSVTLKQSVTQIAAGKIGTGYTTLENAGFIHQTDRVVEQASQQYLALRPKQRAQTLIVAGTNATCSEVTQLIRQGLQAEGELGRDRFQMVALKSSGLTQAQTKYASNYSPGQVIVPMQDYKRQGLERGQQYEVLEIDEPTNTLTVKPQMGEPQTLDPGQCSQISVYEQQRIHLAINEQMHWTRNDRTSSRRNGQSFRVLEVDEAGNATIQYDDQTIEKTSLSGKQFADYNLVNTVYGSQGKTADRVIAIADGRISKEAFYVATSRAKHTIDIYCTDRAKFAVKAQESQANENTSDYIDLFTYRTNHHATNQAREESSTNQGFSHPIPTPIRDSGNAAISLGRSLGGQLAATLSGDDRDAISTGFSGGETDPIDQCLAALDRPNPIAGIAAEDVAVAIAEFIEQWTIERGEREICDAFSAIERSLVRLAGISRTIADRDHEPDQSLETVPPLSFEQEQQLEWADTIFPAALNLMQKHSQVYEWTHHLSETQVQIDSPYYFGLWDREREQLTYVRKRDGQQLFTALKAELGEWEIEHAEGITSLDLEYHRAIAQQQRRQRPQEATDELNESQGMDYD